ncbi:hypothetical protein [Rheinheimera soli]|jgi:hypothetical protein|uniref:Uncharacterized protein n=1 Tax=Rheinheimera soli TaxID=443616 RepID=A0ABU1VXY5_9GAMM|nr:hypothetical protein [Rheinheimera soli]MDR7120571.1 hypothetical protein [Rheinheimera soli]
MNSLSSKQQLLHLLQIQPLELHQEFSAMAKMPEAEVVALAEPVAEISVGIETAQPAEPVYTESYSEPNPELTFAKDVLVALSEYQPDLQWRLNPACTEPMLQNGLLVTPSIELLQSAQQKKLLWLCLQQES